MSWLSNLWGGLNKQPAPAESAVAAPVRPTPQTAAGRVLHDVIAPALSLLPSTMYTPRARVIMLAICGQEADFTHRWQVLNTPGVKGPARGLWQFERGGGVAGVLRHAASAGYANSISQQRIGATSPDAVWQALEHDDVLAGVFARLLLWTDPAALPQIGDVEGAWALYLRCWRPGAWTRGTQAQRDRLRARWASYYAQAMAEVAL